MFEHTKPFSPGRLVAVMTLFVVWCFVVFGRLVQFQVFQHEKLSKLAIKMHEVTKLIPARRGIIYDSQMAELATSVMVSTVVAEPRKIENIPVVAEEMASLLEIDPQLLLKRMMDPAHKMYLIVKRRIDPNVSSYIKALGISGIYLKDESLRVYPNRNLASHTLGFVNMAGNGVAGLEMRYNNELNGEQGQVTYEVDALGQAYREKLVIPPVPGHSLVLSIDRSIQHLTQRELAIGVKKVLAAAGVAIVMESETGRILALANFPDFNCNTYAKHSNELWRNRAIQDQFEPGSTLKVVTASAALDARVVRTDEYIDCQMGSMMIGGHIFRDHKPFGLLTYQQILEHSSNIGAIMLGMRLGEGRLHKSLCSFGFGSKTGVDLPAEATGRVRERQNWSALSIASISFGYEVAVTSMQILTAINVIANGGYRVRPSIVDRIINDSGESVRMNIPEPIRIIRSETAAAVRNAFEGVILRGTGQRASLEGYRVAGKTGTAQKVEGGHFSKTKYIASFIGFAPLPHPRVTILVQIDEPKGAIYGGDVAAPIFQKIAQETLFNLRVPPDRSLLSPKASSAFRLPAATSTGQSLE